MPLLAVASNTADRWELIGGRKNIPDRPRSVKFRFETSRKCGTPNDSYLDAAFVYVMSDVVAGSRRLRQHAC